MYDNFMTSLQIMWMGMLGIFTVIIVITLFVIILEKVDKKLEKK
jgi:ABC-type microcin C transport system permease subunit YejE